jgi:hypothetical protein
MLSSELLFCHLLFVELFDVVWNLDIDGIVSELLQIMLTLFVYVLAKLIFLNLLFQSLNA